MLPPPTLSYCFIVTLPCTGRRKNCCTMTHLWTLDVVFLCERWTCGMNHASYQLNRRPIVNRNCTQATTVPTGFGGPWPRSSFGVYLSQDISELRWPLQIHTLVASQRWFGERREAIVHKASCSPLPPSHCDVAQACRYFVSSQTSLPVG
jgi:hypothetical protein